MRNHSPDSPPGSSRGCWAPSWTPSSRTIWPRTEHAADLIASVRDEVADPEDWEWLMPLAGRLPDGGRSAGFRPTYLGFVADRGAGDHSGPTLFGPLELPGLLFGFWCDGCAVATTRLQA